VFFLQNALYWFELYHIDGLRLDAVHAIYDMSANPFLAELAERVEDLSVRKGKKHYLIAESNLNDTKHIRPRALGGYGLDAQWLDDFHHSLRTLLTNDLTGYYMDFGKISHLAKAYRQGFVFSGQYSAYRKRRHGNSSLDRPAKKFIVFCQNHDQVGNRMLGERLSALVCFEALKLSAAAIILSPYIPMLFMGEEYGEESPFLYFISHMDKDLIKAVREGRKAEFRLFKWKGEPPDPQSEDTLNRSKLNCWDKQFQEGRHQTLWSFYRRLIELRTTVPALKHLDKESLEVTGMERERCLYVRRWCGENQIFMLMNFNDAPLTVTIPIPEGNWKKLLDSSAALWMGTGSAPDTLDAAGPLTLNPFCVVLYELALPS
jgi:maltooligosyltrehalose trehalohydrolase